MKLHFTKKKLLVGGGIALLFVGTAAAGYVASQIFNKPAYEQPKTASGLSPELDETQNLRLEGKNEEANKKADELLNKASTSDETKYELYLQKGYSSIEASDNKAALEFFTQASKLKETSQVFTLIGEQDMALGDKAGAKAAYEKALSLIDPNSPIGSGDRNDLQQRIDILDGKTQP